MVEPDSIPYLSEQVLSGLNLSFGEIADEIEKTIRARANSKVWSAPKASFTTPDGRYVMSTMAVADEPPYLATKSLLLNPRNPEQGHPLMNSIVTLQDSETGIPLALLEGNWITAKRTAALSTVAARRMAAPDARVIAFIGCGVQARNHLAAFCEFLPIEMVVAYGRGRTSIDALGDTACKLGLRYTVAETPDEALKDADLVVSAITRVPGRNPFVDASFIKPGAFAALTDLGDPWVTESLSTFDRIVIDDTAQEAVMKDKLAPSDLIHGDIAGLVQNETPGRSRDIDRTAFIFRGYAPADFALATLAFTQYQMRQQSK